MGHSPYETRTQLLERYKYGRSFTVDTKQKFSPDAAIWKFANPDDGLDDWLGYAENLVQKWSVQNKDEIEFDSFQFALATLLLKDDLLPDNARAAFADAMWKAMEEAHEKKYTLKNLHVYPPSSGMEKMHPYQLGFIMHGVRQAIQDGKTATKAHQEIADTLFKSPDTIRRIYERQRKKRQKPGEIKK